MQLIVFLRSSQVQAWTFSERHKRRLQEALPGWDVVECHSDGEFAERLRESAEPVAAVSWRFEQAWLDATRELRVLATPSAGRDYFQVQTAPAIRRLNGSFHGELMAETALGLLLGHARGLFLGGRLMREGQAWPRAEIDAVARPLRGSHLVVVGFGNIGRRIASLAKPFGVRLTAVCRNPGVKPAYFEDNDRLLPVTRLDEILPQADHLMLILPGGAETDRLLDRRRLALLPEHAAVYNLGRGNAIEEPALIELLQARRIAGAYLDVFAQEPLAMDSALRKLDNVWLLPHASAIAPNYLDLFFEELIVHLQAPGTMQEGTA